MADPTKRFPIAKTGLEVTQLSFGCAPIGNLLRVVSDEEAEAAVRSAIEAGVNYIDAAPFYGYGLAEQRMGRVLAEYPRKDFVVSTKVGRLIRPGKRTGTEVYDGDKSFYLAHDEMCCKLDYSYDGVMRSLEDSLERIGTDYVDILHIHDPDDHFEDAVKGAYKALDKLRSDGTIKAVSAGMNQWEMPSRFMDHGDFDCFLLAGRYTLLDQTALPDFMPKCEKRGVSVIIGGVFNSGLLADPRPGITFNYVEAPQELIDRARKIGEVCRRYNVPLTAAAIQFPTFHPAVPTILTGTRSAERFRQNLEAFQLPIPDDLWRELKAEGLLDEAAPVPGEN